MKCGDCNQFIIAVKNGEFLESEPDPTEEINLRKEGYCSYGDFKRGLDAFFDVVKPKKENVEARLDSMRDVDPKLVRDAILKDYEGHKPQD